MIHYTNTSNPIDFPKPEMNERVRQLMLDAGYASPELASRARKLAELIIQKCIEEAGDPADGLILDDTWHDGVRASVWSIQQYFGVRK